MNKKEKAELKEGSIIAKIKTTNGTLKVLLYTQDAPFTTSNFIGLSKKGYYDGIIFHRIINNFMIQGGDPSGTGMGGESIYGEKFRDEFHPDCRNNKYTLAMANSGVNTNGSQFFINQNDNNYLDDKHSVFGEIIDGYENVDKMAKTKTDSQDRPKKEIKIIEIKIRQLIDGSFEKYKQDTEKVIKKYHKDLIKSDTKKKKETIENGNTINVHYTLTLEDKSVKDSSHNRGEPFSFKVGEGQVIKGWDEGVIGKKKGDEFTLEIKPKDGYGEYDPKKTKVMKRTDLQSFTDAGIKLEVGEKLPTQYGYFIITETSEGKITIDLNHELAGQKLYFQIEIIDIQ